MATGKLPSFTTGSVKWLKILAIANFKINEWANEPGVDWGSLYDPSFTIGTVSATDSYAIPSTVRKLSDRPGDTIRINHTGGVNYTDYDIVPHDDLKMHYAGQNKNYPYGYYAAQMGSNLKFNYTFTDTSPQFGGTIKAPVYTFPSQLVNDSDVVPVDVPQWLVVACAAEYVRTSQTRVGQYPNLLNEANALMDRMKQDNDGQASQVYMPWSPTNGMSNDAWREW